MERQVFISYAAGDTDWTAERVKQLAEALHRRYVHVHLDVWHRRKLERNLSDAEWRTWMDESMASATHVLCLCSSRYFEAWKRNQSVSGGCGVAFESARIEAYLYEAKQNNKGHVLALVSEQGGREVIPKALKDACPKYKYGNSDDDQFLWSHLSGRLQVESGYASQATPDARAPVARLPAAEAEKSAENSKEQNSDLLDRAWRKALDQCSAKVRAEVLQEMQDAFSGQGVAPDRLEQALADAFERDGSTALRAHIKYALHHTHVNARLSSLSVEEGHQRNRLYLMLLIRSVALSCQSILRGAVEGNLRVPDAERRIAIAVASHVIYGHGVQLTIEPDGVRPDNLIDTAAFKDEHAYPPGQEPARTLVESEVKKWLGRELDGSKTPETRAELKAALDVHESKAYSRPILLDRGELLTDQVVRSLVKEFGMGIVDIAADGMPTNIPDGLWLDLCDQLDHQISDLTGHVASKSALPQPQLEPAQGSPPQPPQPTPPLQVNLHQTFSGAVGQSNVTTGSHSPIHAQHAVAAQTDAAHDPLTLAVFGFKTILDGHADLDNDLHELHTLLLRRDASPPALSLLLRLLRPLREAAQASVGAADAWERLRQAAHTYWPDSRNLF